MGVVAGRQLKPREARPDVLADGGLVDTSRSPIALFDTLPRADVG